LRPSTVPITPLPARLSNSVASPSFKPRFGRTHCHLARDRYRRTNSTGNGRSVDRQKAHILGKQWPNQRRILIA
jgi:hypothetical protein